MADGYCISRLNDAPCSQTESTGQIRSWMEETISKAPVEFETDAIDCYRYVASSVKFRSDGNSVEAYQTETSPNYFGGLWSLACCKHDMRGSSKVKDRIFGWSDTEGDELSPNRPMFIFTFGEQVNGHQYLASVALVTRGFKTMDAYGEFLENSGDFDVAADAKITKRKDTTPEADRYGDCHYGSYPLSEKNPHASGDGPCSCNCGDCSSSAYHEDMSGDHVICVAEPDCWITWRNPAFETRSGSKQINRWGRPIRFDEDGYDDRDAFYRDALGEDGWIAEVA